MGKRLPGAPSCAHLAGSYLTRHPMRRHPEVTQRRPCSTPSFATRRRPAHTVVQWTAASAGGYDECSWCTSSQSAPRLGTSPRSRFEVFYFLFFSEFNKDITTLFRLVFLFLTSCTTLFRFFFCFLKLNTSQFRVDKNTSAIFAHNNFLVHFNI